MTAPEAARELPRNWAKEHPSGVREIDSTNECLEFLLERHFLQGIPCQGNGRSCPKISDILRFLNRKFAREEALMKRVEFPGIESHLAEHAALLARIEGMKLELVCGRYDSERIFRFLTEWASHHLREFDDPVGRYVGNAVDARHRPGAAAWRIDL